MYCLRCGSDVRLPNVFCDPCLEKMEENPVPPDAIVHLPEHPMPVTEKKPRKKKRTDADRVRSLRRFSLFLFVIILSLSALICMMAYQMLQMQQRQNQPTEPPKGQNFSTQAATTVPETTVVPTTT